MSEELNTQPQETEVSTNAAVTQEENITETTTNTEETTSTQEETITKDYSDVTTPEKAGEVLESKGFDYKALTEEFQANGDLLPETREKLKAAGFTPEMVDDYISGQVALVEKHMLDIASTVGGVEKMSEIVEWAKANLPEDEKKSIDKVHDPAVIKIILKDLEKRMNDSEGYLPQQLQGGAGESVGDYFESMAEVEEAINDPRYSADPVYRAKVARKLTASREAGIIEIK